MRVALWRALHVQVDPPPHVLEDEIGLRLAAPGEGWRRRPDMHPGATSRARASIVASARFIEDPVEREELPLRQATERGARASGTPEIVALASKAGFKEVRHVSSSSLAERYFGGRTDGLRPSSSEEILVART